MPQKGTETKRKDMEGRGALVSRGWEVLRVGGGAVVTNTGARAR